MRGWVNGEKTFEDRHHLKLAARTDNFIQTAITSKKYIIAALWVVKSKIIEEEPQLSG